MQPLPFSAVASSVTAGVRPPVEPGGSARAVAAQFESLLLAEICRPLATSLGFFGDAVAREVAGTIAFGERGGLTDALARAIADRDP